MCSVIYIINDIKDVEDDKKHPTKKNRPIASGKVSVSQATILLIVLLIGSLLINFLNIRVFNGSFILLLSYLILNLLYSYKLKSIAIIDVFILSFGFVIRVFYGASLIGVEVSHWLFLTILSAALFLSIGKRKKEFENAKKARKVLKKYTYDFLDKFQYIFLTSLFIFYSLWTIEQKQKLLVWSIPMLIIIFMKYSLNVETSDNGDPTTILYNDKMLLVLCFIYSVFIVGVWVL